MKRYIRSIDPYILGGFVGSLFAGLVTPYYVKLVASALDVRVITLGSLAGSLFPFLTGLAFEKRRLTQKFYAQLPLIMGVELLLSMAAVLLYFLDLSYYYVASMIVFGTFTSAVTYLLQIMKQRRYRRGRAAFDRRCAMADAAGYLAGSLLALADWRLLSDTKVLLALGLAQTSVVYLLYLRCYRPSRRTARRAPARVRSKPREALLTTGLAGEHSDSIQTRRIA